MSDDQWQMNFDGGSRGNPGPAAAAAVLVDPSGYQASTSIFIRNATNNEAEYRALLIGLRLALEMKADNLLILGDSKLIIRQIQGEWKVKSEELMPFNESAISLLSQFTEWKARHIPRAENSVPNALCNMTMDRALATIPSPFRNM